MIRRLPAAAAALVVLIAAPSAIAQEPAKPAKPEKATGAAWGAKLDEILRQPGEYSQVCSAIAVPSPAPIPGFRPIVRGEASLSKKNEEFLKKNRTGIVQALNQRLASVDLRRPPVEQPPDTTVPKGPEGEPDADVDPRGVDPQSYSDLMLDMVVLLDAVETFPNLLKLEENLRAMQEAAAKDPAAPVPAIDGTQGSGIYLDENLPDDFDFEKLTEEQKAAAERKQSVHKAQAAQRDILAAFVRIMRKGGYQPLLQSDMEKLYGRLLKQKAGEDETLREYRQASDIPAEDRETIEFDPVHKVALYIWDTVPIPYSESLRQQIRKMAADFASTRTSR